LLIIEFVNNNIILLLIKQLVFFLNKRFYFCISFNSNLIKYKITCARIKADKAKDIFKHIKQLLLVVKQALEKARIIIKKKIDKYWKKIIYKVSNIMFLNSRNIIISKLFKKLDNKMLEFFKIFVVIDAVY
jgi:hypothetical protein